MDKPSTSPVLRFTWIRAALATLVWAGCSTPPDEQLPGAVKAPIPDSLVALEPGTVIELLPCEVVAGPAPKIDRFVDGILREALRLSVHVDLAAGIESTDCRYALLPSLDATAQRITLGLIDRGGNQPDLTIASGSFDSSTPGSPFVRLAEQVDRVAWQARLAWGEVVAAPPPTVAEIYSAAPEVVALNEAALADRARGMAGSSRERLDQARRIDPGCTMTLAMLVASEVAAARPAEAIRLANQALTLFDARLSPTTRHRIARSLLLALSQRDQSDAAATAVHDRRLLELGEIALAERPHDPHGRYSRALALNYLGRFPEALVELQRLAVRWPELAWVHYHACFAALATGAPVAALDSIDEASRHLPWQVTVLPKSLALFHAEQHDELDRFLQRLARRAKHDPDGESAHEIYRIRAAHAILIGEPERAARHLLDDIEWLKRRPSRLGSRTLDLAENGEVLIQLGYGDTLAPRLESLRELTTFAPSLSSVLTYLGGLVMAERDDPYAATAIETLEHDRRTTFSTLLRAAVHRRRGELAEESRELATAVRTTESPLARASFARALDAMGRRDEASKLRAAMRREQLAIRLRGTLTHPVTGPGRALAFLATGR